ncbi:MAG TPA: hypothetical protein PLO39_06485 [Saprospiraceae bacterium]|nr:hypothetical protein [Saprospiraceae bacterium]
MAVNISSSPNEICAIDEPITWGLTISTLGTPGLTQKSIGYQLIDSLGKIIAASEIQPVNTSYVHHVNLVNPIKQSLITNPPSLQLNTVQDALGFQTFTLKYGEITLDLVTGFISGFPVTSSATPIKVVNCTNNNYFDIIDNMTSYKLLTFKPFNNWYSRKSYDWIYVWGACTVTILKDYAASGGGYTGTTVTTLTGTAAKVNCIPIGYKHHAGLAGLKTYMVKLTLDGADTYYKYVGCDDVEDGQPCQIVYFDIGGGYTSIDCVMTALNPASNKDVLNTNKPYNSTTNGGNQITNSKTQVRYNFKRLMPLTQQEQEQWVRFVGAENYYVILTDQYVQYGMVKFIFDSDLDLELESGEYFSFNGYIANDLNSANGHQ